MKQADIKKGGFVNPAEFDRIQSDLGTNRYWEIRDSIPEGNYDVQYVELMGKSNLTDFLRFGPFLFNCPFLISEKVNRIISDHKILNLTKFPARVRGKGGDFLDYKLLHILSMSLEMIDFSKSSFFIGDFLTRKETLQIENADQLNAAFAERKPISAEIINLKPSFADLDLFKLPDGEIVVSERLKMDLEANDAASGINLLPAFGLGAWPKVSASF